MKKFWIGLIVGLVVGVAGTVGLLVAIGMYMEGGDVDIAELGEALDREQKLEEFLDEHDFEVGYYIKNLSTGKSVERNADRQVSLASMVKVFCLTEMFRQKYHEGLDMEQTIMEQTIDVPNHGEISLIEAADLMIGVSDNDATHALADFLGRDKVNKIPSMLGLELMSDEILPEAEKIGGMLDKRVFGGRVAEENLPMHGTARAMAKYYEMLANKEIISDGISNDLSLFFYKHPKPFTNCFGGKYTFLGKGGNFIWIRPPKSFQMMGWGLLVEKSDGEDIVMCVWGEWFPLNMEPGEQSEFLQYVTDSLITIVSQ